MFASGAQIEFSSGCFDHLITCVICLTPLEPQMMRTKSINLERWTGMTCRLIVNRCISFAQDESLPIKSRESALSLLHAFNELADMDDEDLMRAMDEQPVIRTSLKLLRTVMSDEEMWATRNPTPKDSVLDGRSVADKTVLVWGNIFYHAHNAGVMPAESRAAVDADMISFLQSWSLTAAHEHLSEFISHTYSSSALSLEH